MGSTTVQGSATPKLGTDAPFLMEGPAKLWQRLGLLCLGVFLLHFVLIGSSLVGRRILLPLDLLSMRGTYLPDRPEYSNIPFQNYTLWDLLHQEMIHFINLEEAQAGRLPYWNQYIFAGEPYFAAKWSMHQLIRTLFPSPITVAWLQVLKSILAAWGAYCFFRHSLRASYWPALLGAWLFPWTGSMMIWQGFLLTYVIALLPWLLLAIGYAIEKPTGWGGPAVGLVTFLVLTSSAHLDIAGLVLLTSGIFALWTLWKNYGLHQPRQLLLGASVLGLGWGLGLLLASPSYLPVLEHAQTGSRIAGRVQGNEERAPVGLQAALQMVVPEAFGDILHPLSMYFGRDGNLLESAAGTYLGLLATLFLVPLAWTCRPWRRDCWFWSILALFAVSWVLNLPVFVQILRLPYVNYFSYNRFVFVGSFSLLCLSVVGLEMLWQRQRDWLPGFKVMQLLVAMLGLVCVGWMLLSFFLPDETFKRFFPPVDARSLLSIRRFYFLLSLRTGLWCLAGFLAWRAYRTGVFAVPLKRVRALSLLGAVLLVELLSFSYNRFPQSEPRLYFPEVPIFKQLSELTQSKPGRFIGIGTLPPNLGISHKLRDVRGYDGVDPGDYLQILGLACPNKLLPDSPQYARTQFLVPRLSPTPDFQGIKLSPVLDMLGTRYIVTRGPLQSNRVQQPEIKYLFQEDDYWVYENPHALARVFIPRQVRKVESRKELLRKLGDDHFEPAQIAFVEQPLQLPDLCEGSAHIVAESSIEIKVAVDMKTAGLLVLADRWAVGWQATLENESGSLLVPLVRTNLILRGVEVPAGTSAVTFRYTAPAYNKGLRLCKLGLAVWGAWLAVCACLGWRRSVHPDAQSTKKVGNVNPA